MPASREDDRAARRLIDERVRFIAERVRRPLPPHPPEERTPAREREHLLEEAKELYSQELRWEQETEEELTASGELTEMVFPAFLALVDALVTSHPDVDEDGEVDAEGETEEVGADSRASHRDVVHDLLHWLAVRMMALRDRSVAPNRRVQEVVLADRLIDLVLYRYLRLEPAEVELVDAGRP